jgi:hypothetical protein
MTFLGAGSEAEMCRRQGGLLALHFPQMTTPERVQELIDPLGATLACPIRTDVKTNGKPDGYCYIIRLPGGVCCSTGQHYVSDHSENVSAWPTHPDTPCDCYSYVRAFLPSSMPDTSTDPQSECPAPPS